ncbi:MAG: hypothetical protein ACLP9L_05415, partial [Thermoguttaceae bacterium]
MRHLLLSLLLGLPLFLVSAAALGADAKQKAEKDQPAGGARAQQQPTSDHAPIEPQTDFDADKAESDKSDADLPKRPKTWSRPTSMSVIPEPGGLKTLTIHFHWSLFPNASIEVRLVPSPEPKGATVAPIYFSEHLKGTVREALYTCLDHPG